GLLRRVHEISRRDGDNHPLSIFRRSNLASSFRDQSKFAQAEKHYSAALELAKKLFGERHREVANILAKLAQLHADQGHFENASDIYSEALEMMREAHGSLNLVSLQDEINNILGNSPGSRLLRDAGHETLESITNRSIVDHPDTLHMMAEIARLRTEQERWNDAAHAYNEVYQTRKLLLGEDHEDTLDAMAYLATVRMELFDFSGSQRLYEQVLDRRRHSLGENHPSTLRSTTDLAWVHRYRKNYATAEQLYVDAFKQTRAVLGDWHPIT